MLFMPDNLRITTPITNTEGINKPNPTGQAQHVAPINPGRVPKTNPGEDSSGKAADLLLNRTSVYGQFLEELRQTPGLDQTLQKLLEDLAARMPQFTPGETQSVIPKDLPPSLQSLYGSLAAQSDGVLKDLSAQTDDATLFTGPLFRLLDQISMRSADPQFDLRLADFLKAYTGCATVADTAQAIRENLTQLKYSIPVFYAKQIAAVMEKLSGGGEPVSAQSQTVASSSGNPSAAPNAGRADAAPTFESTAAKAAAGGTVSSAAKASAHGSDPARYVDSDLVVLKKEIIPLLADYVSKTNDYGKSRDTISMLLHNTAILNESTRDNLAAKFTQLCRYCREGLALPDATLNMMQMLFTQEATRQKQTSSFLQALTSLLARASMKGGTVDGVESTLLNDITHSLLLDSSVYMPFQHIVLPAQINGRNLFAQLWVEKTDPDEGRKHPDAPPAAKTVYLTFDIQDLGTFEASLRVTGKQINMKLSCPPALRSFRGEIRAGVSGILEKNGLAVDDLRLSDYTEPQIPRILREAIEERKHVVDVTV